MKRYLFSSLSKINFAEKITLWISVRPGSSLGQTSTSGYAYRFFLATPFENSRKNFPNFNSEPLRLRFCAVDVPTFELCSLCIEPSLGLFWSHLIYYLKRCVCWVVFIQTLNCTHENFPRFFSTSIMSVSFKFQ